MTDARGLIASIRGGIPAKCDFCGQKKPQEQMEPEEAGEWVCWSCLDRWEYQERGGYIDMENVIRILDWHKITADGKETARVRCPKCQEWATLDHEIDAVGRVTPSLVCPNESCDFHENVVLAGWQCKDIQSVPTGNTP